MGVEVVPETIEEVEPNVRLAGLFISLAAFFGHVPGIDAEIAMRVRLPDGTGFDQPLAPVEATVAQVAVLIAESALADLEPGDPQRGLFEAIREEASKKIDDANSIRAGQGGSGVEPQDLESQAGSVAAPLGLHGEVSQD